MKKILLVVGLVCSLILAMAILRKDHIVPRDVAVEKFTCEYSKFVDMGGFKIHYTEKGEGIPVVMFHGFAGSHNNWINYCAIFRRATDLFVQTCPVLDFLIFLKWDITILLLLTFTQKR
jgi:hypothetical protein